MGSESPHLLNNSYWYMAKLHSLIR